MRRHLLDRLTIRAALLLGFGLTLGLWLLSGYYFTQRMSEAQRQAAVVSKRYLEAQELFATVRSQVLLGSVYVRDALLDPERQNTPQDRDNLEESYGRIDLQLQRYIPVLESAKERERVARLRGELKAFLSTALDVLASDPALWRTEARRLLRRIVPRRDAVIRVSDEVQALNRATFVQEQAEITRIYAAAEERVWQGQGLALALSLAIAVFAIVHAGRLEGVLRKQQLQQTQNAHELQLLSAKLVSVQEEERRSIARELHDEIGQALTATKMELSMAQRAIEARGGSGGILKEAQVITDAALNTVRDLSHLLHPALLDDLGLTAAVDWYVKGFSRRSGIRVDLAYDNMDRRLSSGTETAVYRIVQEALANVSKHAKATVCGIRLSQTDGALDVIIEDNGRGFDPEQVMGHGSQPHLGLIGVRERVSQLRGSLQIASAPGRGTKLIVRLPPASVTTGSGEGHSETDSGPILVPLNNPQVQRG